ncbi:MFS transporter [Candidatus Bathyarchaeota archaeon]|nr:MFS transporter [Candidatus Bathyarchaeota archaeon]
MENDGSLPVSFYVVSLASFLFELSRHTTQPIFTLYILEMGASLVQVGLILSVQSILMMVVRIPLAMVSDRVGHNRMFLVAFFIQATAPILYAIAPDPSWLYVIPFYQILASGSFNQLAMSTVSNMAPAARQGDALGRYMTFMSMGMFVGPIIAGSLVTHIDYRQLFMVTALFPAIGLGLFLKFKPQGMRAPPTEEATPENGPGTMASLKMILRDRNVLVLTFIRSAYAMSNTVFTSLFAVFAVRDLGFTPALAALLFSVVGFSNAFIKLPAGRVADTLGPRKVLFATFSTLILVYISMSYARGVAPILLLLVLFGACWGTRAVTEWSTLTNSVTQETKTIAISYLGSIWGVGATLGSFMVGVVGEAFPFSTIFLMLALINLPAIPAIYLMRKQKEA